MESNQSLGSAGKDEKREENPERHWSEVLEPYLKRLFEEEDQKSKPTNSAILIQKHLRELWKVRRRFIATTFAATAVAVVLILLLAKPYYDASIVILQDYGSKSAASRLGGLAALAGVSLGDESSAADVYKSILSSETVIDTVVNAKYRSTEFPDSINLYTFFEIKNETERDSAFQKRKMFLDVYKAMTAATSLTIDIKTKILTVSIRTTEPQMSSAIVNNLVMALDSYVRTKRKSNATMQLTYLEKRVSQVKDSLFLVENTLKDFLAGNRVIAQSPQLTLERSRLDRQIQIYQAIVIELTRQLEIARIDEIRDAPIINVQEWAGVPVVKAGPKRVLYVISAFVLILFLSALFALYYDSFKPYLARSIVSIRELEKSPRL